MSSQPIANANGKRANARRIDGVRSQSRCQPSAPNIYVNCIGCRTRIRSLSYPTPHRVPRVGCRVTTTQTASDFPLDGRWRCMLAGMGWAPLGELISEAEQWRDDRAPALVCQGRLPSQMAGRAQRGSAYYVSESLPSTLLDYAVSSADVGLALYDSVKDNDRIMGTASGKLCLYLKNGLPVVTSRLPCFAWVEREGVGMCASSPRDVRAAIEAAAADSRRLSAGALRYYNEHLDFRVTFRPVAAFVEELAVGGVARQEPAALTTGEAVLT